MEGLQFTSGAMSGFDGDLSERVVRPKLMPLPESGVVVFESRHAPGFTGQLRNDFSKFFLFISGRALWKTADRDFYLGPDSFVHVPEGVAHTQQDLDGAPVTLYAVHYRSSLVSAPVAEALRRIGTTHWDLSSAGINLARQFRADFQEMLFEQETRQDGWQALLVSRLLDLAVRTMRLAVRRAGVHEPVFNRHTDSAQRVANYIARLQSRFFRAETLDEAARSTGLSRRQFSHLFHRLTGQSWKKYLQKLRLAHSETLLTQTGKSVMAVAFECGFDDQSHFHRVFKQARGCSPLAFRERHRQIDSAARIASEDCPNCQDTWAAAR